ncbi:MAG: DUF2238 domain-containing protein [Nitrospirae bacterium]|nr:DUF2238 domain-containing protein [Nitrospirota bacterium]
MSDRSKVFLLWLGLLLVFVWSVIHPHDLFTWFLEVVPAIIGMIVLVLTYPKFKFTIFAYLLMAIHATILMIGGHYTYAEVPLFNWIRDVFELSRNHYDRLGHFVQGFVPAIIVREVLLRKSPLTRGKWLFFIVVSICLAISAAYELFEWGVAELTGTAADSFLGTQGDVWDTQKDMAFALIGAIISLLTLGKLHDRFLNKLAKDPVQKEPGGP